MLAGGMVLEITKNEQGSPIDIVTRVSRFEPVLHDYSFKEYLMYLILHKDVALNDRGGVR